MSRQYHFYIPEEFGDDHPAVIAATKYIERPNAKGLFPKYEMWYGVEYFVLRLSDAERAFYQTVTVAGTKSYIYRSTTSTHDHHKETRLDPFPSVLNEAPQKHKCHTNTETNSKSVDTEETNWQESVARLTEEQFAATQNMLSLSQPATILTGQPGSGKSLSVFKVLQEMAVRFEFEGKSGDILFVCETPEHIRNMKREWMSWYKAPAESSGQLKVKFLCYENAIKQLVSVEDSTNLIEDAKNDCLEFITKMLKQKSRNDISNESIYAEFLIHSDKLLDDMINKRSFEESTFNNAGKRHHNLSPEKLAVVYEIYQSYMRINLNSVKINYILQRPRLSNNNKVLLIIADEAHTYSQTQLQTMFDVSEKFISIIDTHQSGSAVANLDLFQRWLERERNVSVNIITLPITLRTPKVVSNVLKKILDLKRAMLHGMITHSAYYTVENQETDDTNIETGSVSCLFIDRNSTDSQWQVYGKSVNFAVIIRNESYRPFAEELFNTKQIFTLDQARGLEFNQLAAVGFFADQNLKLISQKLPSLNLNTETTGNLGSREALHESAEQIVTLNNLFTSFSRVKNDLILVEYTHEKNNARLLLNFLLNRQNECTLHTEVKDTAPMPQAQKESTLDEVVDKARTYYLSGKTTISKMMLSAREEMSPEKVSDLTKSWDEIIHGKSHTNSDSSTNFAEKDKKNDKATNTDNPVRKPILGNNQNIDWQSSDTNALMEFFALRTDLIKKFNKKDINGIKSRFNQLLKDNPRILIFIIIQTINNIDDLNLKRELCRYLTHEKLEFFEACNDEQRTKIIRPILWLIDDFCRNTNIEISCADVVEVIKNDIFKFMPYIKEIFLSAYSKRFNVFIMCIFISILANNPESVSKAYDMLLPDSTENLSNILPHTKRLIRLNELILEGCEHTSVENPSEDKQSFQVLKGIILRKCLTIAPLLLKKEEVFWELYSQAKIKKYRRNATLEEYNESLSSRACSSGYIDYFDGISMKMNFSSYPELDLTCYDRDNGGPGTATMLIHNLLHKTMQKLETEKLSNFFTIPKKSATSTERGSANAGTHSQKHSRR